LFIVDDHGCGGAVVSQCLLDTDKSYRNYRGLLLPLFGIVSLDLFRLFQMRKHWESLQGASPFVVFPYINANIPRTS